MIIVWDCKSGRREFIEMVLKTEGYEVFSASEVTPDLIQQVESFSPEIIICSDELQSSIPGLCKIVVIGSDIELPIEPLQFIENIKKLR